MAVQSTEFTAQPTDIPGLIFFDISFPADERGYFQEKYQKAKLVAAGMPDSFNVVQNNVSLNKSKGVVRGFHAEPWNKYISVITGRVFVASYIPVRLIIPNRFSCRAGSLTRSRLSRIIRFMFTVLTTIGGPIIMTSTPSLTWPTHR
jgi:hypothetical protein